jgi:hypothetical protein
MSTSVASILLNVLPIVIIVIVLYYLLKNASTPEKVAVNFIERNLESNTARGFLGQEKLTNFRNLIKTGKTDAATKEYKEVMNASLDESRLAVKITKSIYYK